MVTPISRPFDDPAKAIQALRDELMGHVGQIRREIGDFPKIPAPVTPTGGGIVGQAVLRSQSGTVQAEAGVDGWVVNSPRYSAPADVDGGAAPTWIRTDPSFPWRIKCDPGWYSAVMFMWLAWGSEADAPESLGPSMLGGWDDPHQDFSVFPRARIGSSQWGIYQYVNHGLTLMHDADYFQAAVNYNGSTAGADSVYGKVNWTITKHA